ncbi:MAG: sigma-70 family RNA polymerase sigma factor, partial [Gaiellaceae bacterium MAG52_C11]|nr:sigma-70 family RNA polymerase sigma factor [Candidatus Gaiellasilicea maunaloa]
MATTAIGIRAARELDELYRVHAAEVYRYVYAVLGHQADAEDVTQTTFVNALRALERGEQPRKPTNWLITIAHNLIRQSFRQQQTRPHEVELDRELASIETDHDGPSLDDLVRALQRIPPSQREALVLRELEGRSYKEIAAILAVSSTALETLIFRARRSLAEEVENLVTCDRAQLALSQQTDGRLGRKERKRLVAHLEECPRCARVAALGIKRRHAFKELALLPLPLSLTLFKGAPSATAAIGVPAIGAGGAAVGSGIAVGGGAAVGSGVATKVAVALVALTVAGGASYEGVRQIRQPATPAKAVPTEVVPTKAVPTKAGAKARPARAGSAKTGAGKPRAAKA